MLEQTVAGSFQSHLDREKQLFAVYDMLVEIAPKDPLEAMIVPQMVTVHFQAMELMHQAAVCSIPESSRLYLNLATKLMRTYAQQMEAFRKNRQKGRQEIQTILRHQSPNTTVRYLHSIGIERVRDALEDLKCSGAEVIPLPVNRKQVG